MSTIAIANQKGGCGKTTTAVNLAASLNELGKRVLLVDLDPQGHAGLALGLDTGLLERTMYDALIQPATPLDRIILPVRDDFDIAPSNIMLASIEQELAGEPGRESRLSRSLEPVRDRYDLVILDCAPSLGFLTVNALVAADEALVPVDSSSFSLHGLDRFLETIDMVESNASKSIPVRALATLFNPRTKYGRWIYDELRGRFGDRLFETVVHYSVIAKEAAGRGLPIGKIRRNCRVHNDYLALATELLETEVLPAADPVRDERIQSGGPVVEGGLVHFQLYAPAAEDVRLAGEFNDWNAVQDRMEADVEAGLWRLTKELSPGKWRYRYIVDGTWIEDPTVPYEESQAGYRNSIVEVLEAKSNE